MKNYNDEYFFLRLIDNPNVPMLALADDFKLYSQKFLRTEPIIYKENQLIQLKFRNPVPKKPQMVDYHSFSTPSPVFSEKLKEPIEKLGVKDIQFVPVLIRDKGDDLIEGYYAIKVCKKIYCADLKNSKYTSSVPGKVDSFQNLVLDNDKLDEIPLEERLIFAVGEKVTNVLYHISVVEKMLDTSPKGMTVYRLSGWDSSTPFYEIYGKYLKDLIQ